MTKDKKPKRYLTGYQVNPQGKKTPIYSTVKPAKKVAGSSLPGAIKKETE
tara:strand:+ start:290 stop:439 length:150 start_codon:yes stop_codon:yes gene_type:complete